MLEKVEKGLFLSVIGLTIFGLIMISSVSIASSFKLTGENDFYFWRHFTYMLIGLTALFFMMRFPLETLKKFSLFIFLAGIGLLVSTFIIGQSYGTTATLWLNIAGFSVQPVELTKLATIIFLSAFFSSGKVNPYSLEGGLMPFLMVVAIPTIILTIQSDFGSLLVLVLTASIMYFVAGANIKHLLSIMAFGILSGIIVIFTNDYIHHRVLVFLDPDLDPLNTGFQIRQALIAIGSGGIWGRGFQNSIQKYDYLPEVQADTIFAAISEEMGLFFMMLFIGVYLFIAYKGFVIAQRVNDKFLQFLAIGITTWFVVQAFINIGVNMALLPNTGITLPLISYGGTSLIMSLASLGILLNISTHITEKKKFRHYF